MEQNIQKREEIEIDLIKCVKVMFSRKKTFITIFLIAVVIGLAIIQFSPKIYKIYRVSMLIQPPVIEELSEADKLKAAVDLERLIVNNAFSDALKGKLAPGLNAGALKFNVVIPDKTNFLEVSLERDRKTSESAVGLLKDLAEVISASYTQAVEAKVNAITNQIKSKEQMRTTVKEEAAKLQEQIKEIINIEDSLWKETKAIYNIKTAEILRKRQEEFKNNPAAESPSTAAIEKYLQDNTTYLSYLYNQLNNQSSNLSIRKINLNLELKNINSQLTDIQTAIDKLDTNRNSISNLKIITQPSVSPKPIGLNRKKILTYFISIGLFLGMIVVLLQEFRANTFNKL